MFVVSKVDTTLTFGKYKGETVGYVMSVNPDYLIWCMENVPWFKMDDTVVDKVHEACSAIRKRREKFVEAYLKQNPPVPVCRKSPTYDHEGRKVSYDEMTELVNKYDYSEETGEHHGYTEHMGQIIPVTYHADGGSTVHFGGPCGPLYVDRNGDT